MWYSLNHRPEDCGYKKECRSRKEGDFLTIEEPSRLAKLKRSGKIIRQREKQEVERLIQIDMDNMHKEEEFTELLDKIMGENFICIVGSKRIIKRVYRDKVYTIHYTIHFFIYTLFFYLVYNGKCTPSIHSKYTILRGAT